MLRNGDFVNGFRETDQVLKSQFRIPGSHPQEVLIVVQDDVQDKAQPGAAGGFTDRFVKGVPLDLSQTCARVVDIRRTMRMRDERFPGCTDGDRFASAGVTGILMWFDDSGGDQQVRFHHGAVQPDGYASGSGPQIHQGFRILGFIVNDVVACDDIRTQFGSFLLVGRRAMHPDAA